MDHGWTGRTHPNSFFTLNSLAHVYRCSRLHMHWVDGGGDFLFKAKVIALEKMTLNRMMWCFSQRHRIPQAAYCSQLPPHRKLQIQNLPSSEVWSIEQKNCHMAFGPASRWSMPLRFTILGSLQEFNPISIQVLALVKETDTIPAGWDIL